MYFKMSLIRTVNLTSYLFSLFQSSLIEGCRLPVRMQGGSDWPLAEIISIKDIRGQRVYYVHYVDCKLPLKVQCGSNILNSRQPHILYYYLSIHITKQVAD